MPEASSQYPGEHKLPGKMSNGARKQVLEYLSKKGYNRTEAMLRAESAIQDIEGRPLVPRAEDAGGAKYGKGLGMITCHVCESGLVFNLTPRNYAHLD